MADKLILGGILAALAVTSCDDACTKIGCGAALEVEFQRAAWTAGHYVVTVIADGETVECAATLPLDCDAPSACGDAADIILLQDGCALAPSEHRLRGVEILDGNTPKSVTVRVEQDGALLGEGAYNPVYRESHPNDPKCGPACNQADSVELALQ